MAEFPALPLFTDAYLADTLHLTTIQHGAYLLLLMAAWRTRDCTIPDDDAYLAKLTRMDKRTWMANREVLLAFWTRVDGGRLRQGRLYDERKFVEQKRNKNVAAGKASALKRQGRSATGVQPNVNETSTPTPTPTPTPINPLAPSDPFDEAEAALRAIPGITDHPVGVTPGIGPIWQLVQQGYDLKRQIIPSIRDQLAKRPKGRLIKGWQYFVPGIVESVQGAVPAPTPDVPIEKWAKRMKAAREMQQWDAKWGALPNEPGCQVPAELVQPTDGKGWSLWRPAA